MNPYSLVASGNGTLEAAALSARLATWHDAMVAHERKIRAGREEVCDEECPHADARTLWIEALEVFGDRAQELTFLRSRAVVECVTSEELVASADVVSEAADGGRHSNGSGHKAVARRSKVFVGLPDRPRTTTAEL
jgi:hypothetical protein